MYIDTNFVAINFQFGGILIVNLSSRKNFQIEYDVLENQIKLVPIRYNDFLVLSNFSLERNLMKALKNILDEHPGRKPQTSRR